MLPGVQSHNYHIDMTAKKGPNTTGLKWKNARVPTNSNYVYQLTISRIYVLVSCIRPTLTVAYL